MIWRVVGDLIDDLEQTPAVDLKALATASSDAAKSDQDLPDDSALEPCLLGISANDHADLLVLRMLALLLPPRECTLTILETPESALKLAGQVAEIDPDLVLVSHLPPEGSTTARYLVRRLRAPFADLPILVGYWRTKGDTAEAADRLMSVGATGVVFRLAEARDVILRRIRPADPSGEQGVLQTVRSAKPMVEVPSH